MCVCSTGNTSVYSQDYIYLLYYSTKTKLETEILNSFKNGLRQEIRLELGDQANAHTAIQKAIEIESKHANQKMLRNETANILLNFEDQIII